MSKLQGSFKDDSLVIIKQMIELAIEHSHGHHESEQENSSEESELSSVPCHPHRPVAVFDFSTIEEQIRLIRKKKQQAKEAARQARRRLIKEPRQIYEADVIIEAFRKSEDLVPGYVRVALKQRTKFIEDKVYLSVQTGNYGSVVSRIRQEAVGKEAVSNELNLVMSQVQLSLQSDIAEGVYDIHPIQRSIKQIPKQPEPSHRLKLKNMLIKSKIVDLKEQFNKSDVGSQPLPATSRQGVSRVKEQGEIWGDQFHLMSEGTRKATQFVRKIREEQKAIKQKKRSKIEQMKSLQVKSAAQHQQFQQQMKKQRHQQLKRRYQEDRQHKQSQKQRQQNNQKQYIQFLKQYRGRKPLFRVKQEQYVHQVLAEQEKRRKLKLQQIHLSKLPIDHDTLLQHQRNYQKTKQQKQLQAKSQRQMRLKEEEGRPRKSFYRGRFHSLIAQQKQESKQKVDPFILRDSLLKKQKEFAEYIRKNYAPVISESKRTQLQSMINELSNGKNEKALSQDAYKKLGNEYLKELRKMIKQLKEKGLLKSPQNKPQPEKGKDYLKEVREKYNFSTIDYSSQAESNSLWLENRAFKLEKDAHMREKVMRLQDDFDIERHMRELDDINQKYIHAAEAKMSLINKLEGQKSNIRTSQNSESAF